MVFSIILFYTAQPWPHNHHHSQLGHLGQIDHFSPMMLLHHLCLQKWLEVSSKKNSEPPGCELCQYQYIRHKKFVVSANTMLHVAAIYIGRDVVKKFVHGIAKFSRSSVTLLDTSHDKFVAIRFLSAQYFHFKILALQQPRKKESTSSQLKQYSASRCTLVDDFLIP